MLRYLPFILMLALTIYAFIDCLNTPEEEVKHLPKVVWVLIILIFTIVGPIVWLAAGRQRTARPGGSGGRGGSGGWRSSGGSRGWVAPDDNPEFLKSLRDEAQREKDKKDSPAPEGKDGDEPENPKP
ncbi:PLD nuclease N-terminal domain-containing protein [Streptomyces sp. NPDC051907]|uniref:PLD nuclease N-terminal domain-containing protein n=1 Tax=Streptomyces sp. NPDC051907 TaxID=3155284 RepID=UPI003417F535